MTQKMVLGQPVCTDSGVETATIAAAGTDSTAVNASKASLGAIQIPAAFTGATVEVQYSNDGSNWTAVPALIHESNPFAVAANGTYYIPALAFNARYIRFVSAGAEAAERSITVFLRG
jgi:hypothetical protein